MKIIFVILVSMHGLIHLMGFLDSFDLVQFSQFTVEITNSAGMLWLFTSLLFLAAGIFYTLNEKEWWIPALIATITSQFLIVLAWEDAMFGTIPNIIIVMAIIIGFSIWKFNIQTENEIKLLLAKYAETDSKVITSQMLNTLPPQVKNWLDNSGLIGKEEILSVHLKQRGFMKLKPDQKKWSKAEAEQWVTTKEPGFNWKVNLKMLPFVHVAGKDLFMNGIGQMTIKIASLIPVVNVLDDKKTNQSTLQRYLLELPWYPSAALSPYITWESMDENSAKATMTYKGVSGSAVFHFNHEGDIEKVSAFRYKDSKDSEPVECIGEVKETAVIDGVKLPVKLDISWNLEKGMFTWYKLEIFDVEFNAKCDFPTKKPSVA